jgi:hypothetical protein
MRPRQHLHADRLGHDGQRLRTEAIDSHTDDSSVSDFEAMDFVQTFDAVARPESDHNSPFVLGDLPPRALAEAEPRPDDVRALEERFSLSNDAGSR